MAIAAGLNLFLAEEAGYLSDDGITMPWLEDIGVPHDLAVESARKKLQVEAIRVCVEHYPEPEWQVLYVDELSWCHNGFDLILRNRQDRGLKILEVKGTSRRIGQPLYYLKKTRRKGRQLSWNWIWVSAMDLAEHPATAEAFFPIVRSILEGTAARELHIVRFGSDPVGQPSAEHRIYLDTALSAFRELNDPGYLDEKKGWLRELDKHRVFGFGPVSWIGIK